MLPIAKAYAKLMEDFSIKVNVFDNLEEALARKSSYQNPLESLKRQKFFDLPGGALAGIPRGGSC